ncbi:MAG: hypothetical protein HC844_18730 [Tabrizicola sp.]|nr:hypothetical protein [Tabrizicola sp.]
MTRSKLLPIGFLALALAMTGGILATAQTAPTDDAAPQAQQQPQRADFRGEGKGHHEGRGGPGRGGSEMFLTLFGQVDADGNGSVTQEEIDAFRTAKVGQADASGDGALSIEEFDTLYREFTRSRMVDMFQELDADGDGSVSAAELDARVGDVVNRLDRDGDGALTLQDRGNRG